MSNYTARAYVKITTTTGEIGLTLMDLKYINKGSDFYDDIWIIDKGIRETAASGDFLYDLSGFIDCNAYADTEESAIQLFFELAKMKENDGTDARWLICSTTHFDDMYNKTFEQGEVIDGWEHQMVDMGMFNISTPLELAENWKQIYNNENN